MLIGIVSVYTIPKIGRVIQGLLMKNTISTPKNDTNI